MTACGASDAVVAMMFWTNIHQQEASVVPLQSDQLNLHTALPRKVHVTHIWPVSLTLLEKVDTMSG